MDISPVTWMILACVLCLLLAVATFVKQKRNNDGGGDRRGPGRAVPVDRQGGVVRRPGGRMNQGMRNRHAREEEEEEVEVARREDIQELEDAGVSVPEGKIGKKKMEKLQAKADKKLQREAEQRQREESKTEKIKQEEEDRKEREKEALEEKQRLEEEKRIREEKERKEYEEYLKMKEAFTIDEVGCDAEEEGEEENKLAKFIGYIQKEKVVLLEDLAAHFKMKTQDAIDRVSQLQEDGLLTGVTDDRGKFIYISQDELEAVAKFIKQQGRVSLTDLAASSNKLVTLN